MLDFAWRWPVVIGQDAAAPAAAGKSLLQYIHSGGVLSYVLVTVSVLALSLVIANLIQLRRGRLAPLHVVGGLERLLRDRNVGEALRFCGEPLNDCFLARVIAGGLNKAQRMPGGLAELRACMEEAGARELDRLERVTQGIGIVAAIGPMLGLLGTVIGMIGAFATIGSASGAGRSDQLAGYMSIALVTTAEGLIVAIPCTIAFAMFRRRLDRLVAEVADQAERLAAPLFPLPAGAVRPAAPGVGPVPGPAVAPRMPVAGPASVPAAMPAAVPGPSAVPGPVRGVGAP